MKNFTLKVAAFLFFATFGTAAHADNTIPGEIDCLTFIDEEGEWYWWTVGNEGNHISPNPGGTNLGMTTDISKFENGEADSPDFVKFNVDIQKAGDYYVFFEASNSSDTHDSACNLYFYSEPLNDEPIHFFSNGGWSDYNWAQGGVWHYDEDEFEGVLDEPTVITITDKMVGKDKKIKLEVVHQWNMKNIRFVPVDGDFDGVDAIVAERVNDAYNLQGVKVANPTKGLFIQNGKKYVVK